MAHVCGKWVPDPPKPRHEVQSHHGYRVGDAVLAVVPSGDRDEREVVTISRFKRTDDGVKVRVTDDDGVHCWIDCEMIERRA